MITSTVGSSLHSKIKHLSDAEWHELLARSIDTREVDGITLPGFPSPDVQRIFVGTSDRKAIAEGFGFYSQVKRWCRATGNPVGPRSTILDFGVGWGRIIRFFVKDTPEQQLFGVDVNEYAVSECLRTGVPGSVLLIDKRGHLPFEDATFTHIVAYSVFTHLAPEAASHWMTELSRVAAEGAVFIYTVEPREFLEAAATGIPGTRPVRILPEQWRAPAADALGRLDKLGYAFLPTVGEHHAKDYGDAVYLPKYIKEEWEKHFTFSDYISDVKQVAQAGVIVRKGKGAPLKVACFMMQKNEYLLVEHWCRYHAAMFGAKNLFVFDNGSTDPRTIAQLASAAADGVNVDLTFTKKQDFATKGEVLGGLAREKASNYDFLMFHDCDEFIAVVRPDGSVSCSQEDVLFRLEELRDSKDVLRIKGSYINVPNTQSEFFFWNGDEGKKVFFASTAFEEIDMGFHHGKSKFSDVERVTAIVHFHFQNKPFSHLLSSAREKLADRIPDFDNETLRRYNGPGAHLAQYFLLTEDEYLKRYTKSSNIKVTAFSEQFAALGMSVPYAPSPTNRPTIAPMISSKIPLRMSAEEAALFSSVLNCSDRYMEFGAGGTTCLAATTVKGSVISVDSSKEWIEAVGAECAKQYGVAPLVLYANIGPTKEWGYPADATSMPTWPRYHRDVWDTTDAANADLYLVDGRFRVASFIQILLRCKLRTLIAFHDYESREHYHIAARFARKVAQAGDLTIFQPVPEKDDLVLERVLAIHCYDPS
jgi:ubiquinone/menaquinone biosynthesis C-methylase UbiE